MPRVAETYTCNGTVVDLAQLADMIAVARERLVTERHEEDPKKRVEAYVRARCLHDAYLCALEHHCGWEAVCQGCALWLKEADGGDDVDCGEVRQDEELVVEYTQRVMKYDKKAAKTMLEACKSAMSDFSTRRPWLHAWLSRRAPEVKRD